MRNIKNESLAEIVEIMRSEEITMCDSSLHAGYIIEICDQLDTHFTAFKRRGIYEFSKDNNLDDDADIIIQDEFEKKVVKNEEECLQDFTTDRIYSYLQDIRNIAREYQENLIEEENNQTIE